MSSNRTRVALAVLTLAAASPCLADSASADAQTGPSPAPAAAEQAQPAEVLQQITVTGTRLSASFRTPTPVMAVTGAQLALASPNDVTPRCHGGCT